MLAFGGLFSRFHVNANSSVFGGAGDAEVGSGIEKLLTGLPGGNIDVHLGLVAAGRGIGLRI
jgi:hypothetical protein